MPKRRRRKDDDDGESSESEYEDGHEENDDDHEPATDLDDEDDDEEEEEEEEDDDDSEYRQRHGDNDKADRPKKVASASSKSPRKAAATAPRSGRRPAHLPTEDRKTAAGGYAHTVESKLRISQANRGNTPWNKGRNRSELDKAKITAGVRARNHLLAKRQREAYGLSEAEAEQFKKKIKYLREKVRKVRVDNDKRQDAKRESREAWAKVEHEAAGGVGRRRRRRRRGAAAEARTRSQSSRRASSNKAAAAGESDSSASVSDASSSEDDSDESDDEEDEESSTKASSTKAKESPRDSIAKGPDPPPTKPPGADAHGPELSWTPHPMDDTEMGHMCPRGGPGGFGCCADCTAQCTQYMVATFAELEKQRISSVGIQVQQLQEISAVYSRTLEQTVRASRRKPTPLLLAYRRPQQQAPTTAPASPSKATTTVPDASGPTVHEV